MMISLYRWGILIATRHSHEDTQQVIGYTSVKFESGIIYISVALRTLQVDKIAQGEGRVRSLEDEILANSNT